ncbi:MAG: carboxypeptidase-like regulatory domain-containing protein [Paludibacteraceae bacterium]|nr:carboxypeptidase-like regulatory domain-containing protein [Paludibacteraceae bacterium]
MNKICISLLFLTAALSLQARTLTGLVIDEHDQPIAMASIYLKSAPSVGTATDADGRFELSAEQSSGSVIVSFIGYQTAEVPIRQFTPEQTLRITLKEQPIALEETVVQTRLSRRKRRLAMEQLLRNVSNRMSVDFASEPVKYRVVSDGIVNIQKRPLAMEQMIGYVVELPQQGRNKTDSIQFYGELSKRYIDRRADSLARHRLEKSSPNRQQQALQIDSGTVVHRMLWGGSLPQIFKRLSEHPKRWSISRETDDLMVLTYHETRNLLGMLKLSITLNYIVNSYNYRLERISSQADVQVNLPFAHKLKTNELEWLNIINLDQQSIDKFKLKRMQAHITRNVILDTSGTVSKVREKNMSIQATATDTRKHDIPVHVTATVKVLSSQTSGVKPYSAKQLERRIPRMRINID